MRAWPMQYDMPPAVILPQKLRLAVPAALIGQRHFCGARLRREQGSALTTSSRTCSGENITSSPNRCVRTCGRRLDTATRVPDPVALRPRDKPKRLILPMTALRETPISRAICPHVRPALRQVVRIARRSVVEVRHKFLVPGSVAVMLAS